MESLSDVGCTQLLPVASRHLVHKSMRAIITSTYVHESFLVTKPSARMLFAALASVGREFGLHRLLQEAPVSPGRCY